MQICLVPITISTPSIRFRENQEDHELKFPWNTHTTVSLVQLLPLVDFRAACGGIAAVKVEADSYGWYRTSTAGSPRTLSILYLDRIALVEVVVLVLVVAAVPAYKVVLMDKMAVLAVGEDVDLEGIRPCVKKSKMCHWTLAVVEI